MRVYLWSTNDGNASWTVNGRQGPQQGTKPVRGKIANCSYSYSYSYSYSRKKFIQRQLIHGCRYCSTNNTNKMRLLMSMCFWVEKGIDWRTNQLKNTVYELELVCSYLRHNH